MGAVNLEGVSFQIHGNRFDVVVADRTGARDVEAPLVTLGAGGIGRGAGYCQAERIARDANRIASIHEHRNRHRSDSESITTFQTRQIELGQSRPLDGRTINRHRPRHGGKRVRCARADGFQYIIPIACHGERCGKAYQVRGKNMEHVRTGPVYQLDAVKARIVERLPTVDLHPVSVYRAGRHRPVVVGQVIVDYQGILVSRGPHQDVLDAHIRHGQRSRIDIHQAVASRKVGGHDQTVIHTAFVNDDQGVAAAGAAAEYADAAVRLWQAECHIVIAIQATKFQCLDSRPVQGHMRARNMLQGHGSRCRRHVEPIVAARTESNQHIRRSRAVRCHAARQAEVEVFDGQPVVQLDLARVPVGARRMHEPPGPADRQVLVLVHPFIDQPFHRQHRDCLSPNHKRATVYACRGPERIVRSINHAFDRQRIALGAGIVADDRQGGQRQATHIDIDVVVAVQAVDDQLARVGHGDRGTVIHRNQVGIRAGPQNLDLIGSVGAVNLEGVSFQIHGNRLDVVVADRLGACDIEAALVTLGAGGIDRGAGYRQAERIARNADRVAAVDKDLGIGGRRDLERIAALQAPRDQSAEIGIAVDALQTGQQDLHIADGECVACRCAGDRQRIVAALAVDV